MAIKISREVNRAEGRLPATSVKIYAGMALVIDTGKFTPYAGGAGIIPYGIADVSNVVPPLQGAPYTVGQGFDYTGFNRGGLVGAFINGSELDLYDDLRDVTSCPFLVGGGESYVVNKAVYADATTGKITSLAGAGANYEIGSVVALEGTAGTPTKLRVKFSI